MRWQDWVQGQAAYSALGLGGARRWDVPTRVSRCFILLMVFLAIAILVQWQMVVKNHIDTFQLNLFNTLIWLGFLIDFMVPLFWAKQRWLYVRDNWMLVFILFFGLPTLFHSRLFGWHLNQFRPFLALYILIPSFSMLLSFFVDGKLTTTLFAAMIVVVVFGLLAAGLDSNIDNAWDGIWWATATVSTVGYGDVVPITIWGRLLGMLLVIVGLCIFVVVTANILGLVLKRQTKVLKREEKLLNEVGLRIKRIEANQKVLGDLITQLYKKK